MRIKKRRGAIVVMLGIMAVTLMSISAISIDFSRMWTMRNELQTSADAAAHAGAVQLAPPNNAGTTIAVVNAYAGLNPAMQGAVTVDSVILGDWDDAAKTFTALGAGATITDAVSVTVSRQSTGLMMAMLGVPQPRIKARAIGWADAPVSHATGCIKPWAIPYVTLMYRINLYRNAHGTGPFSPPDSHTNLTRTFDQVADLAALQNMTTSERTFRLKLGDGKVQDSVTQAMPGNYQAVVLPELWDAQTQTWQDTTGKGGGNAYRDNIAGATCHSLDIGDILATEPGKKSGPTIQGVVGGSPANGPGVCAELRGETDNTNRTDPTFGDCLDSSGNVGVDVKAAFYYCSTNCNGRDQVTVNLLGSFTLTKAFPQDDNKKPSQFEKAEIVGIFKPTTDPGTVGSGSTMFTQVIIVR